MLKCNTGNCFIRVRYLSRANAVPTCLRVPNADGRKRESAEEQPSEVRRCHRYGTCMSACQSNQYVIIMTQAAADEQQAGRRICRQEDKQAQA